jgi:hypothetical protein
MLSVLEVAVTAVSATVLGSPRLGRFATSLVQREDLLCVEHNLAADGRYPSSRACSRSSAPPSAPAHGNDALTDRHRSAAQRSQRQQQREKNSPVVSSAYPRSARRDVVEGSWHHECCFHRQEDVIMGYLLAWLLGVPASILILIFLIRGL